MSRQPHDLPDWQLPAGVTRGLWEYVQSDALAKGYDAYLADSPICRSDVAFLRQQLQEPGRVLDLGCGTGRVAVPLAERGFEVVGVDLSDAMLQLAAEKGRDVRDRLHFLKANLVDLGSLRSGGFNYALCMFGTLGMIQGAENRQRLLSNLHRLLRPGGKVLLHAHNYWHTLWQTGNRGWLCKDILRSIFRPGHVPGERFMPPHQGVANLYMHLFKPGELQRALAKAGFANIQFHPIMAGTAEVAEQAPWAWNFRAQGFYATANRPYGESYDPD